MKITRLDVTPIEHRGLLLEMRTDEGLVGLGSPMNYEHGRTVARAVHDMGDYLIGRDPRQVEDHWQALFRSSYSRQMPILLAALSGIEMACLDILGKSLDTPVWGAAAATASGSTPRRPAPPRRSSRPAPGRRFARGLPRSS